MARDAVTSAIEIADPAFPFDFSRPKEAERRACEALHAAESSGGTARGLELRTQVARAQAIQGQIDEAEFNLEGVHKLLGSVPEPVPRLRYLLELGRVFTVKRIPTQARPLFTEAWELAVERGEDFFAVDAAQMMAVIEPPKLRLAWTMKALAIAERSPDERVRGWRGSLHRAIGFHHFDVLQFERALESFNRAVDCMRTEAAPRSFIGARCWVAKTLRMLGRTDEALVIQWELCDELKRLGIDDGLVFEELAECLHTLKRAGEAQPYFARAHEMLRESEWLVDNQPARLSRLKKLGMKAVFPS